MKASYPLLIVPLIAVLFLTSCGRGADEIRWSEEAKLHDGRIVTLERRVFVGSGGFPTEHRGLVRSWEVCYPAKKIYWKSNEPFQPSHFELRGDEAYVKVPMRGCESCQVVGYPNDGNLYFALRQGDWQRIPASEFPDKRWRNLLMNGIVANTDKRLDIRGHVPYSDRTRRDDITEETRTGQQIMAESEKICRTCLDPSRSRTNLQLSVSARTQDSFCK